jgi:hypothetical protein
MRLGWRSGLGRCPALRLTYRGFHTELGSIQQGECDMRSMLDSDFDDMHGVDVLQDFDSVYFQGGVSEAENEPEGDSVWLECSGELLDVGALELVSARKSACGFQTLLFVCPRCKEPHESVRFR